MTKRVKPVLNIPVVNTVEDADAILAEIAARKRQISLHEIALKEDVDRLKAECAARCEPLKKDRTLSGRLRGFLRPWKLVLNHVGLCVQVKPV